MPQFILINPQIIINSVDLTTRIDQVSLEEVYADIDTTAFGQKSKTRIGGLGDHKFTLEFQQDESIGSTEATIGALVGMTTTVSVKAQAGATSSSNPVWTFQVLVVNWKPVDGKVGDLAKASVAWPVSGDVLKSVT